MNVIRSEDATIHHGENLTGEGQMEVLLPAQVAGGVRLTVVTFKDGARTYWHSHPGEQVLFVLDGEGRVGNEAGEEAVIKKGDVVHTPPGEMHWHGAMPGKNMTHISITTVGAPNWTNRAPD
jgi:quercetin dioxygenase-like cupin family protein